MKKAVHVAPPLAEREGFAVAEERAPHVPQFGGQSRFDAAVPLDDLLESPQNPRKRFEEGAMRELEASVREKGVLTPLLARPNPRPPVSLPNASYEIASGHRRFRAARAAGLATVPVLIREMTEEEFLEVLVIENDHREDVHALEEASGYEQLLRLPGYDVAKIAARVGRSPKYIYDRLKLLQLVPKAQELFLRDLFTPGHAILLARLKPEDQERAIGVSERGYGGISSGLFAHEGGRLWDDDDFEKRAKKDPYLAVKPVSVRELEGWIRDSVRLEPEAVDEFLFPETAEALDAAIEDKGRVLLITREYLAGDAVRKGGKERVFGEQAWRRADGKEGSKECGHAQVGLVSCGPGQGEAFRVCIAKEKCTAHWSAWQKEKKKRQAAAASGGSPRVDKKAEAEQRAEEKRAQETWKQAVPALREAVAAWVRAQEATATGKLARFLLETVRHRKPSLVPIGRTAEDLVRHLVFELATHEIESSYSWSREQSTRNLTAIGIDVKKILAMTADKVQMSAKPGKAKRGTCRKCGCQENTPCNGGCGWADRTETKCTACYPPTLNSREKKGKKKGRR